MMLPLRTCVSPTGRFVFGLHQPSFSVANMRPQGHTEALGQRRDGRPVTNGDIFPEEDVQVAHDQGIYEIANPLPFRGTTYIGKQWADRTASDPTRIAIGKPSKSSLSRALEKSIRQHLAKDKLVGDLIHDIIVDLPRPLKLATAVTSDDPADLVALAEACCDFTRDPETGRPTGLYFKQGSSGRWQAQIKDERLFGVVANNPRLPDDYKRVMVLRPGIQGHSDIVGDWRSTDSHAYEYLRGNSYIPWGHYAAIMADDAIRYDVGTLSASDVQGLRHLYYQRTYVRMAQLLGIEVPARRRPLSPTELEHLRYAVVTGLRGRSVPDYTATLWGWNYGFDFAPNGYRLNASHQQIHQQYALIPEFVASTVADGAASLPAYACGDLVQEWVKAFRHHHGKGFFDCYIEAVATNRRMDGDDRKPQSLTVYADDRVMLFVPKAQTSQWELQLVTLSTAGNILETDAPTRRSLDRAILLAMQTFRHMGADMITVSEYSKRFHIDDPDQRLLYTFLPRLPESPGTFSEAQMRWINGHYPEDFGEACRWHLAQIVEQAV